MTEPNNAMEVHAGLGAFRSLRAAWLELESRLKNPRFLHSFAWHSAYVEHLLARQDQLVTLVYRAAGEVAAIIPLVRRLTLNLGYQLGWESFRHAHVPLMDFPVDDAIDPRTVLEASRLALIGKRGRGAVIRIHGLPSTSQLLSTAGHLNQPYVLRDLGQTSYFRCSGPGSSSSRFSNSLKSNLAKAERRLKQSGEVEFDMLRSASDFNAAFDEFLALEASGWKGSSGSGSAIALHPHLTAFYQSLLHFGSPALSACINRLKRDGVTIAAQFCVIDRQGVTVLKSAYDESCSRFAPGNLLRAALIRHLESSCEEPRELSLAGMPEWSNDWRPEVRPSMSLEIFNRTIPGLLLYADRTGRQIAKRLLSRRRT